MPYLLLIMGLLVGVYALYRFFINADTAQIKALFLIAVIFTLIISLFFMAVTGRLPAAIGLASAIVPFAVAYFRQSAQAKSHSDHSDNSTHHTQTPTITNRDEALKVLGLDADASDEEVNAAYKSLMAKVHPDNKGSQWMAAKLNEARDFLLK